MGKHWLNASVSTDPEETIVIGAHSAKLSLKFMHFALYINFYFMASTDQYTCNCLFYGVDRACNMQMNINRHTSSLGTICICHLVHLGHTKLRHSTLHVHES